MRRLPLLGLASLALVLAHSDTVQAAPGVTTRVSVASDGTEANGYSGYSSVSADGRFVAFESTASNLVSNDTNGARDVFVHDRQTGSTERVSLTANGAQTNGSSFIPVISGDGHWVAFWSEATNILGDNSQGVFVRDLQSGSTARVAAGVCGNRFLGLDNRPISISHDGRFVAFDSSSGLRCSALVHDMQTATSTNVSVDSNGVLANDDSWEPDISSDGRFVAFHSEASNLVPDDTNICYGGFRPGHDVFVHDLQTGATERVSVASDGGQGNCDSEQASISGDGRFVAFASTASNLVPNDTNNGGDVFVHDRQTGQTKWVSITSNGSQFMYGGWWPSISGDGRFVAFGSSESVFIRQLGAGKTARLTGKSAWRPAINENGRFVPFDSSATTFVAGDTNFENDVFVHDLGDVDGDSTWNPFDSDSDADGVPDSSEGECWEDLDDDLNGWPNDGCPQVGPTAEDASSQCYNVVDDDGDGLVNDGCPAQATDGCYDALDGDLDGWVNDGCGQVGGTAEEGLECANATDDDSDNYVNDGCPFVSETAACGSDPLSAGSLPERVDGTFAGMDDDGDTQVDEALPSGAAAYDCDGDGFVGTSEAHVGTSDQDPCGGTGWPGDLAPGGIQPNAVNLQDISSFIAPLPRKLNTSSGDAGYNVRWDLVPGAVIGETINLQDLSAMTPGVAGPTAHPPMLGGAAALGKVCPWPP